MFKFILVFLMVTVVDFLWAAYIRHISQNHIWKGSFYAAAIALFSGFVTITYVNDNKMIIPAVLGAFVGTFICLKLKKDNK